MTDEHDTPGDDGDGDAALIRRMARALTEDGELLPVDEAEVMRAEEEGVEDIELPPALRRFDADETIAEQEEDAPAKSTATDIAAYRRMKEGERGRSLLTHVGAMLLGAVAAAAALVVVWKNSVQESALGGDPGRASASTSVRAPEPQVVLLSASCDACCGGSSCAAPHAGMENCPSGMGCIACEQATLADSRYRLRMGAVHPAPLGLQVMRDNPQAQAELCVRAGASDEVCVPTQVIDRPGGLWATFPMLLSGDDLAAKLAVRLRWKGVQREPLATAGRWTMPVALTARSLCSGYVVELKNDDKDELFGTLSLFLDDAYYVELMRGPETGPLRDYRKRLTLDGVRVQLQEVSGERGKAFVLAAGPYNRQSAERLRWQLLEQKQDAKTSVGLDYMGEPLPLP